MRPFFTSLLFLVVATPALCLEVPYLTGPLVDEAHLLSSAENARVLSAIDNLNRIEKAQLAVLIIPSLEDETVETFGIKVAEKWKLGKKGKDNGLLFLIAPNNRKMRLEVGYGLEGDIPDAYAKRILSEVVSPYFRTKHYADGIISGIGAIQKILGGEPPEKLFRSGRPSTNKSFFFIIFLIQVLIFIFTIVRSLSGFHSRGFRNYNRGWWGTGSSGWGGSSGGSGWGGSSSGSSGGFSGGGGSFGGGGSSDSW